MIKGENSILSHKPSDLKNSNKSSILRYVYHLNVTSKPDIAKALGMSRPTVSALVDELVSEAIFTVMGIGKSTTNGGKRPILYSFNPTAGSAIAINIGIDTLQGALVDLKMNILARMELKMRKKNADEAIQDILAIIKHLIDRAEDIDTRVLGIGVSSLGLIESRKGVLVNAVNLAWNQVPIRSSIEERFRLPVWVDNATRNMAIGEKWFGLGQDLSSFIILQTKGGIGTGIMIDGAIYQGADNSGGEFGHTTIDFNGAVCRCGNRGCWEVYASEENFLKHLAELLPEHSDSTLSKRMADGENLSIGLVSECLNHGDEFTQTQVFKYVEYLGIGIVNLVNVFNPEMIILEGELIEFGNQFLEKVEAFVKARALSLPSKRVRIHFSTHSKNMPLIGAATLVIQEAIESQLLFMEK